MSEKREIRTAGQETRPTVGGTPSSGLQAALQSGGLTAETRQAMETELASRGDTRRFVDAQRPAANPQRPDPNPQRPRSRDERK
jgi:hypothetical protein